MHGEDDLMQYPTWNLEKSKKKTKIHDMGLLSLLEVAFIPNLQVLLMCSVGAFLSTDYCNLLPAHARISLNKIVFAVFTPCLMFANLAKTVTFQDIVSWWFMPVNIVLTFLFGGLLGWIVIKILKPKPYLEGLVMAVSSTGNLGYLLLIIIPAICDENGSPFGNHNTCASLGLSYASFSMALSGFFQWTYTYHLLRKSSLRVKAIEEASGIAHLQTHLLHKQDGPVSVEQVNASKFTQPLRFVHEEAALILISLLFYFQIESQEAAASSLSSIWAQTLHILHTIFQESMTPPSLGAIVGLSFGAVSWLKNLVVGENAPLKVIQDSVQLLGNGTIPSTILILGGNLIQGLRSSKVKPKTMVGVMGVRYLALPAIGILVVKVAKTLGFLAPDPLYQFLLMVQYTTPPAMSISTMTQLFGVGQEECSVIMLWTYLTAALSLALWSALFMWILP
ncbi:protein PIN-LIKES 7-like isoform X1 [Benincasa hispida]|uniref:protein PIN-LIKES 7-like isoform X1 n=1 Tax=Benincasa hispida TaxID=102211 RepID=UPI001901DC93|nr:protein PIN-LIKES 7-like isoform X1 [Benincasa hispida]XP_038906297.1 protein PIN-LIKES 7-like isoform X1 [Benincasa hispida]XP_038906298.1 protein PIN-LIKES 7-like isoform X1 [Benincasa hispida]XP_038906299.1 protein PIN-LIKES 7-like isoform X1 [Benincasa hispida]XP_038906300.1 protein PIN-LIKES 7-like isoform X1 [Benincasa hispida]XP_038906301.1 protein PIN-LIKES 7-like isoform X1 [Benincasa hispida]XP_038906302.1 protein PIN-LIKES 7-like isoform X1 [Benincasa hispida]XP_038906303.1 pro